MRLRSIHALFWIAVTIWTPSGTTAQEKDQVTRLLEELSNAYGPPGFEGPVREILTREMRAAGSEVSTDGLGSVIGMLRGSSDGPRIMVAAHMDEVGALVRSVTSDGFVKFQTLGGFMDQALINQRWWILTRKGPLPGLSGLVSPHVAGSSDWSRVIKSNEIVLDLGLQSKQEAEALGVRPGDPIVPASPFAMLANGRYVGKAMDDRVGCVVLLETLRRLKAQGIQTANTIYFVGTVQEEMRARGARTAAQTVKPDIGISLDAGVAADHPGASDEAQGRLGSGPVIHLADIGTLANLKLRDFFQNVASENRIPLQTEVSDGIGTDSTELQFYDTGRPTISLSVPARYMHNHNSVIDRKDLDRAVDLMVRLLVRMDAKTVAEISRF